MGVPALGCSGDEKAAPATSANASLSGVWALTATWGTSLKLTTEMTLAQSGMALTGSAQDHLRSFGSAFSGSVSGTAVAFDRVDSSGFRSTFVGSISADGNTMSGTVANEPSSPGGNNAAGTWIAYRGVADAGAITCADLTQCCAEPPSSSSAICSNVAGQGSAASCSVTLEAYWGAGQCRDIGPSFLVPILEAGVSPLPDGGGPPDASGAPDGAGPTADASVCGTPSFSAGPGDACTTGLECVAKTGQTCAGTVSDSCPCQGVQFCCIYATAEYCYYDPTPSVISTAMSNCGGTPATQP